MVPPSPHELSIEHSSISTHWSPSTTYPLIRSRLNDIITNYITMLTLDIIKNKLDLCPELHVLKQSYEPSLLKQSFQGMVNPSESGFSHGLFS